MTMLVVCAKKSNGEVMKKYLVIMLLPLMVSAFAAPPILSGKCGIMLNTMKKGVVIEDDTGLSGLGVLDFDKKTAVGSLISYDSTNPKRAKLVQMSWTFQIQDGYFEGSAVLVPSDLKKPTIQILPVNGGNSYLLHLVDTDSVGVCQKI